MAVSLIYSLFHGFGSGLAVDAVRHPVPEPRRGLHLAEGHPNEAGAGKRPMHTIIPAMLREGGRITMPFGVMGGAYQATGHARLMSNLVDHGMELQAAHRRAAQLRPATGRSGRTRLSDGRRRRRSPRWATASPPGPRSAARRRSASEETRGVLVGASDPRKDGCALGYLSIKAGTHCGKQIVSPAPTVFRLPTGRPRQETVVIGQQFHPRPVHRHDPANVMTRTGSAVPRNAVMG
jgi:gamma-glutamyltranspeptidase / glutathione hydrolase